MVYWNIIIKMIFTHNHDMVDLKTDFHTDQEYKLE